MRMGCMHFSMECQLVSQPTALIPHSLSLSHTQPSHHQLLVAAATLSKHSSAICSAGKAAAARATGTLARREFLRAVKTVADSTAVLLAKINVSRDAQLCYWLRSM